jgi:hypothetical protein
VGKPRAPTRWGWLRWDMTGETGPWLYWDWALPLWDDRVT